MIVLPETPRTVVETAPGATRLVRMAPLNVKPTCCPLELVYVPNATFPVIPAT